MNTTRKKYIFLAGGLSAGPIMPLFAVAEEWRNEDAAIWPVVLDVKGSVAEHQTVEKDYQFERVIAGKFRRYFSWHTFMLPFQLLVGIFQSIMLIKKYRPIAVLGAGGFVQLPVIFAAWLLKVPRFIHQQDVSVTLSNALCAPFADRVTVAFESSIRDFPQGTGLGKKYVRTEKVIWTGNPKIDPTDAKMMNKIKALEHFGLHRDLPVLLVVGGGTGAVGLNNLIYDNLGSLTKVVQILHSTGKGKADVQKQENYHPFDYISDMDKAYVAADIVVSRAGLGALTDIAEHKKPAIIIPMPDSHQEVNAELLFKKKAALVLDQNETTSEKLIGVIRELLFNTELSEQLGKNFHNLFPPHAAHKVYKVISNYLANEHHN